ncbi:MAG TPA: 2-phospho-L-lactate guanylyltransferase [Anaerolineae bacterium]|nr:2-phospho-L-lactate guanylyltransferase [Anaerolineae bacterium]
MTLHIIIPVKHLSDSKSRLAPVLAERERRALALRLLRGVLSVVRQAQEQLGATSVVVSPDPAVLALAAAYGLTPLPEDLASDYELRVTSYGEAALNAALEQATAHALTHGASAVLILPADLPLVTLADVERLWRASRQFHSAAAMVIAPDGQGQGTNALLVRPPGALQYQFGPGSFQRHCQQARELGLAWHIDRSARLGLDVDLPADLEHWLAIERSDSALAAEPPALEIDPMHDDRYITPLDDSTIAFLQEPGLLMRLGTVGSDGYPQVTPIWYLYDEGRFWITTASDRVKARNMLARPQVGFAIDSDQRPYRGVSARGVAQLVAEGEAARPITRRIAARYVPPERLEAMVETLMEAPRVVFAIEARRVVQMGSW